MFFLGRAQPDAHFTRLAVIPHAVGHGQQIDIFHPGRLAAVQRILPTGIIDQRAFSMNDDDTVQLIRAEFGRES